VACEVTTCTSAPALCAPSTASWLKLCAANPSASVAMHTCVWAVSGAVLGPLHAAASPASNTNMAQRERASTLPLARGRGKRGQLNFPRALVREKWARLASFAPIAGSTSGHQ